MRHIIFTLICIFGLAIGNIHAQAMSGDNPIEVKVFPNPVQNQFNLDGDISNVETIFLYNLIGKRMKDFQVREGLFYNVSDLPNGLYLIQFISADGSILTTKRLNKR